MRQSYSKLNYIDNKPIYGDVHFRYHDNGQISYQLYVDTLIQYNSRVEDYNNWDDYDYSDFKFYNYRLFQEHDVFTPFGKET